MPDEPPASTPPPKSEPPPEGEGDKRRIERAVRELFRRAVERGVEAGVDTISKADRAVRGVVDDVPLPREVVGYIFNQIDDTKNALVRVVAGEVRDFLDATDVASELQRALTSLSFEIKTEVRFIPNDAGGIKPRVKATAVPRVKKSDIPPPPDPESDD